MSGRNLKRNEIQSEAIKLLYFHSRILLSWATGCGKSLASVKMILHWYNAIGRKPVKGYIICKEKAHLDNFNDDILKHNMGDINDISEKFLYASLHKYQDEKVDFLILDEAHAITNKRMQQLHNILKPNTVVILLTATVEGNKRNMLYSLFGNFYEYHISINKAIVMGLLSKPKIYIHRLTMDPELQLEYDKINNLVESEKELLKDPTIPGGSLLNLKRYGLERKNIMAEAKTEIAKGIMELWFSDSKFICFTPSKPIAEHLAYSWNPKQHNYVHSDNHHKYNAELRKKFNTGEIDNLFVVKMFRESMNLQGIEKGLIIQLENAKLSFIQMLGRVFRSDYPEMHLIVWRDTKDEQLLNKVMRGFNKNYLINVEYD